MKTIYYFEDRHGNRYPYGDKLLRIIFAVAMIIIAAGIFLTACNYDVIDLTYQYNYAYIQLQNGEVVEGRVESWRDYEDGEQLQVVIDGVTYLTNSYNCTLIYDPKMLEREVNDAYIRNAEPGAEDLY